MGWFSDQIEQRRKKDSEIFGNSFIKLAGSVVGEKEAMRLGGAYTEYKDAVTAVARHFKLKEKELSWNTAPFKELLDATFSPEGIMYRYVNLEKGWFKEAYGAMITRREDNGQPVALLPKGNDYYFFDEESGRMLKVNSKTETFFSEKAILFYQPFELKRLNVGELLKFIWKKLEIQDLVILLGVSFCISLVGLLVPAISRNMLSGVLSSGSKSALVAASVFFVCVIISRALFEIVKEIITNAVRVKVSISVEAATMMRVLSLPTGFFKKFSAGELSDRMSYIRSFCEMLIVSVLSLGITGLFSLIYVGQIFLYASHLLVTATSIIFCTILVSFISTVWQMKISRERMEHAAKEVGMEFSFLSGIQKIRLSGAEKRAFSKWAEVYAKETKLAYNPPVFLKLNNVINMAVSMTGIIIIYYMYIKSGISAADYYAFNSSFGMLQGAFSALASVALIIADLQPILKMCTPILDAEPEITDGKQNIKRISGAVELNNVTFAYNDNMPKVIDNLSLKIRSGEYIAIVGETGCGKSTLIRLLLGFEKPQRGAVYYDGVDIQKINLRSLRKKIGVVMQDGKLFHGDIFSNIAISSPGLTMSEAWEAAEIAGIADDIKEMAMGMHTLISEGSGGISGGQKQRLMIARAVASKPRLLIFDEATSALDNITQKKITTALDKLKCTRIVIAHRLSTIMQCDRIVVLNDGNIAEEGKYDELIEKGGLFAKLVERQRLNV